MKKTINILTIISLLLTLIIGILNPTIYNSLNILKSIYFEIIVLIIAIYCVIYYSFNKKKIYYTINKYYILFSISDRLTKLIITISFFYMLIIITNNLYYLSRAKVFYFQNFFMSSLYDKGDLLNKAVNNEKLLKFDKAILNYEQILNTSNKYQNNTFIKRKIQTLKNRILYSNIYLNRALNNLDKNKTKLNQEDISAIILSYRLYPNEENKKVLQDYINLIKNNFNKTSSQQNINTNYFLGTEILNELSGKENNIDSLLKKVDKKTFEKYIINSYSINKIDTIANNAYKALGDKWLN